MFDSISSRLGGVIRKIRGSGVISEKNVEKSLKEIKMSLLEADVNYRVVKEFISKVKEKALGESVLRSLSPDQQFIKIVNDELTALLGGGTKPLDISKKPLFIMLAGLQGSGKTTTAGKLARYLKEERGLSKILLVGADTYRPAAREQLEKLAAQASVSFYSEKHDNAVKISENARKKTEKEAYDAVIFDTAGRLHIDEEMIRELEKIKQKAPPDETFLVADAMLGQESVNVAKKFSESPGITGLILTKIDGDARGGAALSMKYAAGTPVRFMGTGEKIDRFEIFHPDRIAGRILGMGDIVSLAEKAQKSITEQEAKKAEEKLKKASFTFEDFLEQMQAMKNMGPLGDMLKMIPGAEKMGMNAENINEDELKYAEAIILSMTPKERVKPEILDISRKRRIAKGAGVSESRVGRLVKQFSRMKKMMKKMAGKKGKMKPGSFPGMPF